MENQKINLKIRTDLAYDSVKNYKSKEINGLVEEKEKALLKILAEYPKEILSSATTRSPYKITNYIQKLATSINEFYTICRVIDRNNLAVSSSRMALCKASEIVLKNALEVIGVTAPERM